VFRAAWMKALRDAKVDKHVRPGWLRHSGASLAYAASRDLKLVSKRLGHTSTRMVDSTYVSLYEDASRAVADAIDELLRASAARETDH
jgi:integrase